MKLSDLVFLEAAEEFDPTPRGKMEHYELGPSNGPILILEAPKPKNSQLQKILVWNLRLFFVHVLYHSLSRVVVPVTLHNISVNAHFTKFL